MSSETLNFGPEWLRNLSHGGRGGNNITSPPLSPAVNSSTTKFKLAKNRYGREEMLALFEEDTKIPLSLQALPHILSIPTLIPLTLTPITAEDQVFSGGVNSETTFRGGRGGFILGRTRGSGTRGRGRGRGGTDFSRSISQNEEGIYPRGMTREYNRQSWDDRSTNRGIGVRHFDDPPPRGTKPMRRADVSGNWRDDAMRAGGGEGTTEVSPSPNPRVAGAGGGGWRDTTPRGSSWRDGGNPATTGSGGGSYRPPNRNNQVIRRSVSTGASPGAKYDNNSSNENGGGGNSFLPEWAGDDDGDTEVGVFDSTGAFLPRSSVASEAGKKGGVSSSSASPSTTTTTTSSSSDNNNNGSDKKKTRRQSALHSTLDKIDEQNHNNTAATGRNHHTATTPSGHQSPPSSNSPTAAAENHKASSSPPMGGNDKPAATGGRTNERTCPPPPPTHNNSSSTVPQSPIRQPPSTAAGVVVDDGTNNNHPHHDVNLNKAKEMMALQQQQLLQQQQAAITTSSEDGVLRASSLIPNDVMSNDYYVPKAIPNTFQDPNKDAVGELLSRSKMNENFDGLAESTIRILDEADDQQRAPFNLFHHQQQQQQQQQHEQVQQQQQPFDVATQHIKSLFASNQPSSMVPTTPQQPTNAQSNKWFYKDPQGEIQGPFNSQQMADWFKAGYFSSSLLVRRVTDSHFEPLGEMFRRHQRNPFTAPAPVVQPVQHVIQQQQQQQQQSQLIDQQQQQFRQEMQFRNFIQHTKEVQEQQLQAFKSMLVNNLNKNPEFCAMSGSQQQVTLNQQIAIFQHQLVTQQQQQISQYLSNNANAATGSPSSGAAAATSRTIAVASGGAAATPSSIVGGGSTTAAANHPSQVATSHHEALNPWEVDPAIVRRPSPGATQQEQQHFMQLLKKKTAEQEEAMRKAEDMRKQRELQLLYRQRVEEERLLKEEEEKQKNLVQIEEERLRQTLAKEEEARMRKVEEAEQLRLMQEKKIEKQRKYEEERKRLVDEARRKKEQEEEERRRKRREEEELEKKRRAQEEEDLKKKQAEEEYVRRQRELQLREARKKKEVEDLKKLNLPSTAQWAATQQVANPTQSRQQPTVAEIQKIEEAKERELRKRKEQEQKRLQAIQQAQKQSAAPVWGGNAAQHLASNHVVTTPSLAEIQREEAKKAAKQRQESAQQQQQKAAVVTAAKDPRPAINHSVASGTNSAAAAGGGKWSNRVATASKVASPTTAKKSGPAWGGQTFQQATHQPVVWDQPTLAQSNTDSKKQQQVRGKRRSNPIASEKNNVVALFENSAASNPAKHSQVFFKWCSQEIGKIPQVANFDIPTVFAFLCDVQSPYEVKDYIHEVFGDSQVARDFGDAFLKKRAEAGNANVAAPKAQQQQLSTANQRKSASMSPSAAEAAAAAAAAELVTGNTKRGKRRQRKLQKIDPSILGFSVNAASDRVNMGEIDTPRDV